MVKTFKLSNEEYDLEYETVGHYLSDHELQAPNDDDDGYHTEIEEELNQFSQLLYRSESNTVLIENWTSEEEELYDPYDLLSDCFLKSNPDLYIREELYDAIDSLSRQKGLILKIYQFYDNTVNFYLIDDTKFYERLQKTFGTETIQMINDYINQSILNSDGEHGWICAKITNGKYEKWIKENEITL